VDYFSAGLARPMHPDWARSLRDQCARAKVPFLFKQWGNWSPHPDIPVRNTNQGVGICLKPDGRAGCQGDWWEGRAAGMNQLGKKKTGRSLDGQTYDEFPAGAATA